MITLVAGIDIGGTNQTVAIATPEGDVLTRSRAQRPPGGTAEDLVRSISALLEEALAEAAQATPGTQLTGIGIGFGGPVDHAQGTILTSHHVAGWSGFPLRQTLTERFGVPVVLDNDANAGALGEARFGVGHDFSDFLYVNIGAGIGGGIIVRNRLLRGAHGLAGEIGHMTVVPGGAPCDCGKRGCLEAYASGRSLGRRARAATSADPTAGAAILALAGGRSDAVDGHHLMQAATAGDRLALTLVRQTAGYLGLALGNAANLLDPAAIILGGGVAGAGDVLLTPLREHLAWHLMPGMPAPAILQAALGYDAGVMGAIALALELG